MGEREITVKLTKKEHGYLANKVNEALLCYLGYKIKGLKFSSSEESKVAFLTVLEKKLSLQSRPTKRAPHE